MSLRIVAGVLFVLWALLVAMGKGGFVHLLIIGGICVAFVDVLTVYRSRRSASDR